MDNRFQRLVIETGEGLSFSQWIASPFLRGLALFIDICVTQIVLQVLLMSLTAVALISLDFYGAAFVIGQFVVIFGYWILLEWLWRGQTIGKRLFKLRVVDATGLKLMPSQVILRNLLRPVDSLPVFYLVGGVVAFLNAKGQRLGDIAAGTAVIREPIIRNPSFQTLESDKYNSFRDFPHLAARLRQRVEPEEALLALEALNRREKLAPEARLQLYRDLAEAFRARCPFPETATLGLSDEQYLRNCLDLLFRKGSVKPSG